MGRVKGRVMMSQIGHWIVWNAREKEKFLNLDAPFLLADLKTFFEERSHKTNPQINEWFQKENYDFYKTFGKY